MTVPDQQPKTTKQKVLPWVAICVAATGAAEGLRNYAYRDPVGIPTICFGETKGVKMGDFKTTDQCNALLVTRIQEFDREVVQRCAGKELVESLPAPTRAAFVSFAYNVGPGGKGVKDGFCRLKSGNEPTMLRLMKAGDLKGACNQLLAWTNPKWLRGLTIRRNHENEMCLSGLQG